ncbi:MAG: hypothetical protein EON58_18070, partial [Alphaproteobacteria bacterium]
MTTQILFSILLLASSDAFAGAVVSYHGRITNPDGSPLESSSVTFKVQVRSPGSASCLLYEETRTMNLAGSNGLFVIPIGDGNGGRTSSDPGIQVENVFSNNTGLNFTALACNSGTAYVPSALDSRRLVVTFNDTSSSYGPQAMAPMDINYVPLALHALEAQKALTVGGVNAANVLRVTGTTAPALTSGNYTELMALIMGTSTQYLGGSTAFTGDVTGAYSATKVVQLQGRPLASTAPTSGQYLSWNGSTWLPTTPAAGGVTSVAGRTGVV